MRLSVNPTPSGGENDTPVPRFGSCSLPRSPSSSPQPSLPSLDSPLPPRHTPGAAKQIEGELLVKFRRGTLTTQRAVAHGWAGARRFRAFNVVPGLEQVRLPQGVTVKDAIARIGPWELLQPSALVNPTFNAAYSQTVRVVGGRLPVHRGESFR